MTLSVLALKPFIMKNSIKFLTIILIATFSFSACTFGDKGKEKTPNTVDTSVHSSPAEGATGNGINPAPAVNTGHATTNGDTVNTDSVATKGK